MSARSIAALALVCVVLATETLSAQTAMEKAMAKSDAETTTNPALPAAASQTVLADPHTKQKYLEAMQRFYEYRANGYSYRSRVFEWQLLSSRLIFVIVLLLVLAGVYFAAVQFNVAMLTARRRLAATEAVPDDNPLATKFEVSAKGIVINSSVLGVIILGLSLAFFYLYLVYVYPIQNVF